MGDFYFYLITINKGKNTSSSETKTGQSFEDLTYGETGEKIIGFKKGVDIKKRGMGDEQYYGPVYENKNIINQKINTTTSQGSWGNTNQKKINFGKDAFSLGINKKAEETIPTYNLTKNTIQNFTLPNGQNLLSFLKKNNVQNGENVEIKITKDGVELIKTESN